jgi:hypothetical protein
MDTGIEGRMCRAAGLREGSPAGQRLLDGVLRLAHMREQVDAPSRDEHSEAHARFGDALQRLRSATESAATWTTLVDHGQDDEMLSILRRLDVIENQIARAPQSRRFHRGDSARTPLQAKMGFARLLMLACRREAKLDEPTTTSEHDPAKFYWLVQAILECASLPDEGSETERTAILTYAGSADGRRLLDGATEG